MLIVAMTGGLGNQMYQYAVGRALALKKNQRLILDFGGIEIDPNPTKFDIEVVKFKLSKDAWKISNIFVSRCVRGVLKVISLLPFCGNFYKIIREKEDFIFKSEIFEADSQNIFMNGCWQSFKYFKGIESELLCDFESTFPLSDESKVFLAQIKSSKSVSVHVRRGDFHTKTGVRNPKVFLFDEPLSNLDAALRGDMRVELAKLHQNLQTTMIYVTHDQIEAMTMADKIVVLRDGVIEQVGSPMDLYHHPKTKFVAGFIGHPKMNFLKTSNVEINGEQLTTSISESTSISLSVEVADTKTGDEIEVGIRPEDLELTSDNKGLSMNIEVVEHIGATVILYGSVEGNSDFCAVLPSDTNVSPGETVHLALEPSKCHAFNIQGQALYRQVD